METLVTECLLAGGVLVMTEPGITPNMLLVTLVLHRLVYGDGL